MTARPFHEATVLRRQQLTRGMVRLTFNGEGLSAFRSTGIADEYVRLFFPDPETGELVLPEIDGDGRWIFPAERHRVHYSTYTVRRFDQARCELDIDLVVHAGGRASDWACGARAGDRIVINNPRGLYKPPPDLRWQVLIGDATGLPAIARILETCPADIESRIFIEIDDEADRQELVTGPCAPVVWLCGEAGRPAQSKLLDVLPTLSTEMDGGYLWVAAEKSVVRALRSQAESLGCFADRQKLVSYWSRAKD
ncbi:siderophore-interacting protein [Bosea sp. BH3]|uniref:siderophore-interacting protein n=1 Tax=Bosea sp. BH3 TaxID=2871701 RepID=UPI0021CB33B8|nr:siderophore-interacting protein [Bosea sp. BH3]MCU4178237.1 siderophore-interacting protein [Bosea sp. BH3]